MSVQTKDTNVLPHFQSSTNASKYRQKAQDSTQETHVTFVDSKEAMINDIDAHYPILCLESSDDESQD